MEADLPDIYPLTGLQIGDIQCYISRAFLYFAPLSKKVLILVDNQPWLTSKQSRSARLWQLMVTKYRMSPFVNSRAAADSSISDKISWALHGFLVFEVSWRDVHGINYLNELLTDTSLALEARHMKKWEFYSAEQAAGCTPLWFQGRASEAQALRGYLRTLLLHHRHDHQPSGSDSDSDSLVLPDSDSDDATPTPVRRRRRRRRRPSWSTSKDITSVWPAAQYNDSTLILFRFRDGSLPLKLRQIIMSDIRLLTLLESGLPAWVILAQSYPLMCHLYRPWMRPLARTLYVLASLATVIIGFYDLYKNVPLLKATAARICGPLFAWIETWDMLTRIQYLGTILFLRNLRKCLDGLLTLLRAARVLLRTVAAPLADLGLASLLELLWAPFDLVLDCLLWPVLQVVRCAAALAGCAGSLLSNSYNLGKDMWEAISSIFELNHMSSEAQQSAFGIKALWNDLFSQIFRAIRSILNGILLFFASCNRHRLSIYNHMQSRLRHMLRVARLVPYSSCHCQHKTKRRRRRSDEVDNAVECDVCK